MFFSEMWVFPKPKTLTHSSNVSIKTDGEFSSFLSISSMQWYKITSTDIFCYQIAKITTEGMEGKVQAIATM